MKLRNLTSQPQGIRSSILGQCDCFSFYFQGRKRGKRERERGEKEEKAATERQVRNTGRETKSYTELEKNKSSKRSAEVKRNKGKECGVWLSIQLVSQFAAAIESNVSNGKCTQPSRLFRCFVSVSTLRDDFTSRGLEQ